MYLCVLYASKNKQIYYFCTQYPPIYFYIANKFKGFKVQNEFPRITPNDVKAGITKAKYVINLGACADYETPLEEVFKKE